MEKTNKKFFLWEKFILKKFDENFVVLNYYFQTIVDKFALISLIKLAARFINDESPTCQKYVSLAINKLISTVSEKLKNEIFSVAQDWLESDKVGVFFISTQNSFFLFI